MQIILTEDVVGVGDIGETLKVKGGFARNYLIPQGLAFEASSSTAKQIAHRMKQLEAKRKRLKQAAQSEADKLRDLTLEFNLRFAKGGTAFGSITAREIAERLNEQGIEVDRRRIIISETIKKAGTHFIKIKLHAEVFAQVKVIVTRLDATASEEEQEAQSAREMLAAEEQTISEAEINTEETPEAE